MLLEVGERKELVGSVEIFIVFTVAALDLAIVSWSIGADELVVDAELGEGVFKEGRFALFTLNKAIGKLRTVVSLNAFNEKREFFDTMADELGRGIGTVFQKGFEVTEATELIEESVLVKPALFSSLPHKTGCGDELHVDLDALAGILHLLVRLWDILGVG